MNFPDSHWALLAGNIKIFLAVTGKIFNPEGSLICDYRGVIFQASAKEHGFESFLFLPC